MNSGRLAAPAFLLVLFALLGNTPGFSGGGEQARVGRDIYNEGLGQDTISVRLGEGIWQPARGRLTCRACHGEAGEGGSEGGIVAPPLTSFRGELPDSSIRWLEDALTRHRGQDRRKLGDAMPRYHMTGRDIAALASYIDLLPDAPVAGLTSRTVTIGVDTSGASLTQEGHQALADALEALAASVNGEGGLYGRRILFQIRAEGQAERPDTLIGVSWAATRNTAPLTLAIQTDGESNPTCGSVDPDREQQAAAVMAWIKSQGRNPAIFNEGNKDSSTVNEDVIILSRSEGWADKARAAERVFLSSELAAEMRSEMQSGRIRIIAPGDISTRVASARVWLQKGVDEPRDAMIVAVYREALDIVLEALRSGGRRIYPYATCEVVKRYSLSRQKVSIISGAEVVTLPAFASNGL